jgi:hypothetical protein
MNEDSAEDDLRIVRVSFCDPYILVLRHDLTILVLQRDAKTGELAELPNSGFQGTRWRSANFYQPSSQSQPFVVLNSIRGQVQVRFLLSPCLWRPIINLRRFLNFPTCKPLFTNHRHLPIYPASSQMILLCDVMLQELL